MTEKRMPRTTARNPRRNVLTGLGPLLLMAAAYACGSADGLGAGKGSTGSSCDSAGDCQSGSCVKNVCEGSGGGSNDGKGGLGSGSTGSGSTGSGSTGTGSTGSGSTNSGSGGSGSTGSGSTGSGSTGSGSTGSGSTGSGSTGSGAASGSPSATVGTTGPHFKGSGNGFRPLTPGCGPETADQCTGSCEQQGGLPTTVIRPPATLCFAGEGDPTPDDPSVVIEQVIERRGNQAYVHIRVTFDPAFTDNTYGSGSCCGWPEKRGHTFTDLTKSDHTELLLTDASGETVMNFKVDLATPDAASACGVGTLGVTGGDGSVIRGDAADVLAVATSLDRNLNGCGYCKNAACGAEGDCTINSPKTDDNYSPNPAAPNWDYRQVYEVWVALDAFGTDGFGQAYVTYTHSSPAKGTDTITVKPSPCPPTWDRPYCPPNLLQEGGNCFGSMGGAGSGAGGNGASGGGSTAGRGGTGGVGSGSNGGTGNTGNTAGTGGTGGGTPCPPNYQLYLATEGAAICTPIPFSNYPGMAPCPTGYALDTASEGQYCLPVSR